jgi:hypothetical protein
MHDVVRGGWWRENNSVDTVAVDTQANITACCMCAHMRRTHVCMHGNGMPACTACAATAPGAWFEHCPLHDREDDIVENALESKNLKEGSVQLVVKSKSAH